MSEDERLLNEIKDKMSEQIPIRQIQSLFPYFSYDNRGLYSSLALLLTDTSLP